MGGYNGLLAQAAKDRAAIEALSPKERALLDMQMSHLKRELDQMWRCIEAGRTSSQ